jgi:hypothetical protein
MKHYLTHSIMITFLLLSVAILSGCQEIPRALRILDDAIRRLETESYNWRTVLEETRDELIKAGQSTIATEVSNTLSRAVSDSAVEIRCTVDFMRDRVREDLIRIRAQVTHEKITRTPRFCKPNPLWIDYQAVQDNRVKSLDIDGYNFQYDENVKVILVDHAGQQKNVTSALAYPSSYLMTLKFGGDGVVLNQDSDKLIFTLPESQTWSFNIVHPAVTPPPPPPDQLDLTLHLLKLVCHEPATSFGDDIEIFIDGRPAGRKFGIDQGESRDLSQYRFPFKQSATVFFKEDSDPASTITIDARDLGKGMRDQRVRVKDDGDYQLFYEVIR